MSMRRTHAQLICAAVGLALVAACTSGPDEPAPDASAEDGDGWQAEAEEGGGTPGPAVAGLEGVETEVLNAVAPYHHDSNIDSVLTELAVRNLQAKRDDECAREKGFTDAPPSRHVPDRDDPELMANLDFPDTDRLAREGLRLRVQSTEGEEWSPSPEHTEALRECREEQTHDEASRRASELFEQVRGAWQGELSIVDANEGLEELRDEFRECLRDEGIPAEAASDELRFLLHVDELTFEAGGDLEEQEAIGERYGKLYAECGRELFEARERLRVEQREEFLAEHADAIRELSDLLYGDGS